MTQVVLHYAHTFDICTFHFQSYPSSDTSVWSVSSKKHIPKKWLKLHNNSNCKKVNFSCFCYSGVSQKALKMWRWNIAQRLESVTRRARVISFVCKGCCLHVNNKQQHKISPGHTLKSSSGKIISRGYRDGSKHQKEETRGHYTATLIHDTWRWNMVCTSFPWRQQAFFLYY